MSVIDDTIADARAYAATTNAAAEALVAQAQSTIGNFMSGPFISGGPGYGNPSIQEIPSDVPEFQPPTVAVGSVPDGPTDLLGRPDMDFGTLDALTAVNPGFTDPQRPSALRAFALLPPDVQTQFDFPLPPDTTPIPVPVLPDRAEPTKPDIIIPVFDGVKPTEDLTPPSDLAEQFEANYRGIAPTMYAALVGQMDSLLTRYNPRYHEQMEAIEAKLQWFLAGGTGLSPAVENAIWERSKSKVDAEYFRTRDTIYDEAAKRGMSLPDGAVLSAVSQARQAGADNNAMAAVEIAVKQAELEQRNLQFAVTTSAQLRTMVMNAAISYHGSLVGLNGQALEYARTVLSATIQVYELLVKSFMAKLDAYRTDAQVYETRMRGAMALIEIYKAEIDALQALVQVDKTKVDMYQSRINALNALVQVYKTQVETVVVQASLEKLKIELFGEQVRAFAVEAQAKTSEWQGYAAAVSGQEAKLRAYGEEVRAYTAKVEAYRARVQAKATEVQSVTEYNRGLIAEFVAQIQAYTAQVDAKTKLAMTQVEFNKNLLMAFQAKMAAHEAQAKVDLENWRAQALRAVEEFRALATAAIQTAQISTEQTKAVASVATEGARVYGSLAGAALTGINTLSANIGYPAV